MAEPDEEGIDLHPRDPRRRFITVSEGVTFMQAEPFDRGRKSRSRCDLGGYDRRKLQPGKGGGN